MRGLLIVVASLWVAPSWAAHGYALWDDLKYPAGFTAFDYVNPDAPKGGLVRLATTGTFDTLNIIPVQGSPAAGLGILYEPLMTGSLDQPFDQDPGFNIAQSACDGFIVYDVSL